GYAIGGAAEVISRAPDVLSHAPEAIAGLADAAGDVASSVFETIVDIISGLFNYVMAANVEIKARITDPERLRAALEEITGGHGELLIQEDVFFRVPTGRLKLRIFDEQHGELIAYKRVDQAGPKLSEYTIAPTTNPAALRSILENLLGVIGVVRKQRLVFLIG